MITSTRRTNLTQKNDGKFILTISNFAQTLATFALKYFLNFPEITLCTTLLHDRERGVSVSKNDFDCVSRLAHELYSYFVK